MKIGIIAHLKYAIAEPFAGGLEMHTHLLSSMLSTRGHDVTLFASEGSQAANVVELCAPTGPLEENAVDAMKIKSIELTAYTNVVSRLKRESFDIVHFNALHYLPLTHAKEINARFVAVLHTPPFLPLEAAMRSAGVDCIAVSSSLASQWGNLSRRPVVIPNGIDLDRFCYSERCQKDAYAFWHGRIVPEKGLHLALEAACAASLPLRFAGPILDREYWESEIMPRLSPGTIYLGHRTQHEISEALQGAAVFLCTPRWEEPFGLVAAEALACGTPVAAFARGALPEVIDSTCGALANADDVEGLSRAALNCLRLSRAACRTRVDRLFDAERMIDQYEKVYADGLTEAGRPRDLDDADLV